MSRTRGARDTKPRKKRKFYAGKPIKKRRKRRGKLILYKPTRKREDPIKVWFWERKPMSIQGYKRWNKRMRPYLTKTITKFVGKPLYVNPKDISSPDKLGNFALDVIQYPGHFLVMMPSHSKNSYRCSYKKKAEIKIIESDDELLHFRVYNDSQMSHYWFYKK